MVETIVQDATGAAVIVDNPVIPEPPLPDDGTKPSAPEAENVAQETPFAETAFITYLLANGDFYVTGDMSDVRTVARPASTNDSRLGAHDVYNYLSNENLIRQIEARNAVTPAN